MTTDQVALSDGALLRNGRPSDLEVICELLTDRGESADAIDLELLVADEDAGWSGVGVVEADGKVVATATLVNETIRVGVSEFPIGQIELVACAESHEHRGYVRSLMKWCHALSYTESHVAQVMIGIPYFYRRFGYNYAIPMHPYAPLLPAAVGSAGRDLLNQADVIVRPGTEADISDMAALQERIQASFDVAMPHQEACWRWLVQRDGSTNFVAERHGQIVATARWTPPEDGSILVSEVASIDEAATAALLRDLAQLTDVDVQVHQRPHVPGLLDALGTPGRADWYYVRVEDHAALFGALRPELERRLAASDFAAEDRLVELSCWESQMSFPIANGRIGPIAAGGPRQIIVSEGGSGLPPDAIAHLVFGCGAAGLEARFPDCFLGEQRALMEALFPAQAADLLTWYLPG